MRSNDIRCNGYYSPKNSALFLSGSRQEARQSFETFRAEVAQQLAVSGPDRFVQPGQEL